jgi:hypothetical protein
MGTTDAVGYATVIDVASGRSCRWRSAAARSGSGGRSSSGSYPVTGGHIADGSAPRDHGSFRCPQYSLVRDLND